MGHVSTALQSSNLLLRALAAGDFALVGPRLIEVPIERGQVLEEQGESVGDVYFLYAGTVSLLAVASDEELVEVMMVGREGAIGLGTGLGSALALSRAVVQIAGRAGRIAAARWAEIVAQNTALTDMVVRYSDVQLSHFQQAVACNALHDVEARLCRWLLEARDRTGGEILPLSEEFLADRLGLRRATVTLVARKLQSAGLVRYRRGMIHIRDPLGLEECACDCYRVLRHAEVRLLNGANGAARP
jgi:CRP-like cAMP-binding protein